MQRDSTSDSRAHPRLPVWGRVGAADAGRPDHFPRLVEGIVLVAAEGPGQAPQVLDSPVVEASEAFGDRPLAPRPFADCEVDRQQLVAGRGERRKSPQPGHSASGDSSKVPSRSARTVGRSGGESELLRWDGRNDGLGPKVPTLRDRLPVDLRGPSGPDFDALRSPRCTCSTTSGGRDRQPDPARGYASRLGPGPRGRLPRGQMAVPREAKQAVRDRLHGHHPAVPAPHRVPAGDATDRTDLERTRRRSDIGASVAQVIDFAVQVRIGNLLPVGRKSRKR
jgi:hypothetical protein